MMVVQQAISECAEVVDRLHANSKRWKTQPIADEAFNSAFAKLRQDLIRQSIGENDQQALKKLEQQVRRVQRDIRREMCEINEKLEWLEREQRRMLSTHQYLDSSAQDDRSSEP